MRKHLDRRCRLVPARMTLWTLLLGVATAFSGCYVYTTPYHEVHYVDGDEIVASEAPPPPQEEVVTVAPAAGYVWVGGYWGWYGGRYVWVSGGWHRPPQPGAVWVAGSWTARPGGGHVWVRGRWK